MLANSLDTVESTTRIQTHIASISPFKDLPEAVLDAIAEVSDLKSYPAGETLYALGQFDGEEIFVIASGALKASFADPESGSVMIDIVPQGHIFGLAAAISEAESTDAEKLTLTTEDASEIVSIEANAFRTIVAQRPSLTRNLMHHFAEVLSAQQFNVVQGETSPEQRIYAALMEYVERDAVTSDWRIVRMPKHRELADKADVEESLVASAVAQLIQDGVAQREYPGLIITNMEQLGRLAS